MRAFAATLAVLLGAAVALNAGAAWLQARRDAALVAAASALAPGQVVRGYVDVDERGFQRARLLAVPPPRLVALGSSRVMQLSATALGAAPGEFYNAGLAGASVEDFVAVWSVLVRHGRVPPEVFIVVDPWAFNAATAEVRWGALADDVEWFLRETPGGGGDTWRAPLERAVHGWYRAKELLAFAVLRRTGREALATARAWLVPGSAAAPGPAVVAAASAGDGQLLRADGSLRYDARILRRSPAERAEAATQYVSRLAALDEYRWSEARAAVLERLWADMRRRGVTVLAATPPYHPVAWQRLRAGAVRHWPEVEAGVARLAEMAARHGVRFLDASDPAAVPCPVEEFIDGDHAEDRCLARVVARLRVRSGRE